MTIESKLGEPIKRTLFKYLSLTLKYIFFGNAAVACPMSMNTSIGRAYLEPLRSHGLGEFRGEDADGLGRLLLPLSPCPRLCLVSIDYFVEELRYLSSVDVGPVVGLSGALEVKLYTVL